MFLRLVVRVLIKRERFSEINAFSDGASYFITYNIIFYFMNKFPLFGCVL